ncbi:MAG: serine/threonine protein kinase [Planctomycetes bacterium]|jgi:serine/threonine protein kinase|nr:serine/threonine protein kinase [Planctomycetota bacterium]
MLPAFVARELHAALVPFAPAIPLRSIAWDAGRRQARPILAYKPGVLAVMTMPSSSWERIKALFLAALELPESEREAWLSAADIEDSILVEVRQLLAAHQPTRTPEPRVDAGGVAAHAPSEGPGVRVGPYLLVEVLGEGGFGTVYAADQEAPVRRRVALKILKPGMDSARVLARFEQERQALALMDHPNIARVFDAGSAPSGRPYFVMEMVDGRPIADHCDRERLDAATRLRLFVDVARAVQHAHQKGVIHRDLKPSNILVAVVDGRPVPKVIDFGIAKATQGKLIDRTLLTEHQAMVGTPLYMSPEQADLSGVDVDTRSDVYSLGVLLYELLTGTTPFSRDELVRAGRAEMERVLREVEPPKPSTRVAALGETSAAIAAQRGVDAQRLGSMLRGDLDWIVMRCLEKERARRYATAQELALDVERHLAGEAVEAAPPSVLYRVGKLLRRRRRFVWAASLFLALGSMAAVFNAQRANAVASLAYVSRESAQSDALATARAYVEIGDWDKARHAAAHAESLGVGKETVDRLMLDVFEATGDHESADAAITRLRGSTSSPEMQDIVHLLWWDPSRVRTSDKPDADAEARVRQALERDRLPAAWQHYARALLAESAPDALRHLEVTLAADPRHRRAAEMRLWLTMLLRGPAQAIRLAEHFVLLWPRDDYGYRVAAACHKVVGNHDLAEHYLGKLGPESRQSVTELLAWIRKIRSAVDRGRQQAFGFSSPSASLLALLGDALTFVDLGFQGSTMSRVTRVHPIVMDLGPSMLRVVTVSLAGRTKAITDEATERYPAPTLLVLQGVAECKSGEIQRGLRLLQRGLDAEEDLWCDRQGMREFAVAGIGFAAFRAASDVRLGGDKALIEAITSIGRHMSADVASMSTNYLAVLTEAISVLNQPWLLRSCCATLLDRNDLEDIHRFCAAASLIRLRDPLDIEYAAQLVDQFSSTSPRHPRARTLKLWLHNARAGKQDLETPIEKQPDAK